MKKPLILILNFLFIASFASQIIFNDIEQDITVHNNDKNMHVNINRINIEYENEEALISINGAQHIMEEGNPSLPFIAHFVYTESENDINVKMGNGELFSLKQKDMAYAKASVFKNMPPVETARNESVYSRDEFFPEKDFDIIDAGYSGNEHMFIVRIYPIKYNPVYNTINVSSSYDIEVNSNYSAKSQLLPQKYLIVMPPHSSAYIDSFIMCKRQQGYIVSVLFTDTAGGTADSIKAHIQNIYDNSIFPLTYVLLLGDTEFIPNFTGTELNSPPTDLYYTTLEGSDYFPDIYAGRISVNDSFELDTMLKKIIKQENSAWISGDQWVNRAYLMASNDASYHLLAEGTQNYAASKLRSLPMNIDSLYYYYNSGTSIADAVNNGKSIMLYTGHGTETSWSGPPFSQSNINALNNADMNPVIFSFACLTGDFAHTAECYGETWMKNSTGSSAYIGSSVTSLWYEDDIMERVLINAITDSTQRDLGFLLNVSKRGVYAAYGGGGYSKRYFEMYNLLGDPSMKLNTDIKGHLSIEGNSIISGQADSLRYYILNQHIPVKNVSVSILMNDSLINTGITDKNGYIALANTCSAGDSIDVYAYAPDYRYGFLEVICNDQSYIDLKRIVINDAISVTGIHDSIFSAGDMGWIKLEIINYGNDTITDISALYRPGNDHVVYSDSVFNIADSIFPWDTLISSDSISFIVIDSVQYGAVQHIYTVLSGDSSLNEFNTIEPIAAPFIYYEGFEILNKSTNEIQGGDSLTMIINIKNRGDMPDKHIISYIITGDTLMSAENDTFIKNYIDANSSYSDTLMMIISDTISDFTVLPFIVSLSDTFGNNYMYRDSFFVNTLDYLVLDYDMNHNSGPVIHSILNNLGYNGHYKESIKRNELYNYRNIFMCRGVYPNAVLLTPSDSIANLLDTLLLEGTHNLYMEGGECWYFDVHVSGGYDFSEIFGINGINDGNSITSLTGLDPFIANSMTFTYSGDNLYLDHLEPDGGTAVFSDGSHIMGVSNKTGAYRTVGFSFEMGGLDDDSFPSTKSELLQNIMDYFNRLTGVINNNINDNKMSVSYGSINREQCDFIISGNRGDIVNIDIFDISGRIVLSDNMVIGSNRRIQWTADMNNSHASGIYFFRLENGSGQIVGGKFLIIR